MTLAGSLEPEDVKAVSNKLCDTVSIIDEYLLNCKDTAEEHRDIING